MLPGHLPYNIGGREALDMRFIAKNNKDFTIKTAGSAWKKEDGPFGLVYNVCEKHQLKTASSLSFSNTK
ncbi:hypothetical protein ALP69_03362 [Pseudomonas syringae pv. aceris]|nr:hypothetical protein ALP69_03362 [Pseudomonas syringae pv. aceris]